MGYFNDQKDRPAGEFYHRETKARFEFRPAADTWAAQHGLEWEIAMSDGSVRFARLLRTVAYIAVDVNDDRAGSPVLELSGDTKGEKRSIDFEVIFHYLCHTSHPLATPKMKYSGFCATNIEKFPVYKNLETVVRFRTTGFQVFIRKLLV